MSKNIVNPNKAHTVGGTISGLKGTVILKINGANALTLSSNGSFSFPILVNEGAFYSVSVETHPAGQTCTVLNGSGTMGRSAVNNVTLVCASIPARLPKGAKAKSFLVEETKSMERIRRLAEQDGERRLARVNAREHGDEDRLNHGNDLDEAAQNGMLQHPNLDNQRFDGINPNLNPEPALNTTARREYDNERRNQEQEKQLRLGNMPKFTAPTPRGPQ